MFHLELFKGTGSFSKITHQFGLEVFSIDIDATCEPTLCVDLLDWDHKTLHRVPDLITASPVCSSFSQFFVNVHKRRDFKTFEARHPDGILGDKLLAKTLEIYDYFLELNPALIFVMENPRGFMFKSPFIRERVDSNNLLEHMTYYKSYNWPFLKRTNIWCNKQLELKTIKEARVYEALNKHLPRRRIGYTKTTLQERYAIPPFLIEDIYKQCGLFPNISQIS